MTDHTDTAALTVDELRADFEHSKRMHLTRPRFSTEEIGSLFAEIDRLRGEAKVMRGLLGECATVLENIDAESNDEAEELNATLSFIRAALSA